MGLDMYLSRKHYVQNWDHMTPDERHQITISKGGKTRADIKPERITYVIEQVAYWRKANAIHKWFVDNCQDGVDDCREAYVDNDKLVELRDLCARVLAASEVQAAKVQNGARGKPEGGWEPIMEDGQIIVAPDVAKELLPTTSGFFFGGTDYDNYYLDGLRETFDVLDKLLKESNDGDYYYHSSW